ncbi:MAG TPA: anthranilate phosphoribosyltransferase [Bacillota bacterium]
MKKYLEKLMSHEDLTREEIKNVIYKCFARQVTDIEIAAFLIALRKKGETPSEIASLAECIRNESIQATNNIQHVMDNCGTGGDNSHSFNISTTSAFVIAGAGVTIAKHGNRGISSKTGSADVLEHLGVSLDLEPEHTKDILAKNKIAFLYAPAVHGQLDQIIKVRKELKIPTIFNFIGPLTNPIQLDTQMMGIYERNMLTVIAKSLHQLGRKRAVVINGAGYMDEASLAGDNHITLLDHGHISSFTIHPSDVNLPVYPNEAIRGGDAKDNAHILLDVLNGKQGSYYDTVIFNAGIGLFASGVAQTIQTGIEMAKESIASGSALKKLQTLVQYSEKYKRGVSL